LAYSSRALAQSGPKSTRRPWELRHIACLRWLAATLCKAA
jgi:hypothetical protein